MPGKKGSGQKYLIVAFGVGSGQRLPILALVRGFLLFSVLWRSIFFFHVVSLHFDSLSI